MCGIKLLANSSAFLCFCFCIYIPLNSSAKAIDPVIAVSATAIILGTIGDLQQPEVKVAEVEASSPYKLLPWDQPRVYRRGADFRSHVWLGAAILSPVLLGSDLQQYSKSLLVTFSGVWLTKGWVRRFRPYAYVAGSKALESDSRRSFFSAHASLIGVGLTFAAKEWQKRWQGSNAAAVWFMAAGLAGYGAWTRVEAGMHYPSDVILGLVWGWLTAWSSSRVTFLSEGLPLLSWQREF